MFRLTTCTSMMPAENVEENQEISDILSFVGERIFMGGLFVCVAW